MEDILFKEATKTNLKHIFSLNKKLIHLSHKKFDDSLNAYWYKTRSHKKFFISMLNDCNSKIILVYHRTTPIGFVAGTIYWSTDIRKKLLIAEIKKLFIIEEYRKYGIGNSLMQKMQTWAKTNGANILRIEVFSKNVSAIKFYKNFGFEDYDQTMELRI